MCTLRYGAQCIQNSGIHLTGICLCGNSKGFFIAHSVSDHLIQLLHLRFIIIKQLHKARLCTGCPFAAAQLFIFQKEAQLFIIQ